MDLPSFLNEKMQICMHACEHACTKSVPGDKNYNFFQFQGQKIILKPDVSTKNHPDIVATCVSYDLRHFSGQLVKFEEFYSNFYD